MKVRNVLKPALAALAGFGTLIPQTSLNAADSISDASPRAAATSPKAADESAKKIIDLELDQHGRLLGFLVDTNGKPEALQKVTIRQGRKTIAVTKTDENGRFLVRDLRGGVYQIESDDQAALVRVWSNGTAPPKSKTAVLLVTGEVKRGQGFIPFGALGGGLGLAAGIAGVTVGVINMSEIDDLEEENADLKDELDRLENSLR